MRLWTIQSSAAWNSLEEHGILKARREHQDDGWPEAYAWVTNQLKKRVGPPPHDDSVPLWGWAQYEDADRKRPDLRRVRHIWGTGECVMIECELPAEKVLLSDFHAWHHVLNNRYLSLAREEAEAYAADRRRYETEPSQELFEDLNRRFYGSWERIFDLELLPEADWGPLEQRSIQACFWELRREQVKSAKSFTAVSK